MTASVVDLHCGLKVQVAVSGLDVEGDLTVAGGLVQYKGS